MNPLLPLDKCIADPEVHVFGDRVYIFGSHDKVGGESFCLLDYEFFSSPINGEMKFTSRGINYSAKDDPGYSEESKYLYAPDVVRGNDGRYYLYYALSGWKGKGGYSHPISVAVSYEPDGKYEFLGYVRNKDGSVYDEYVCFDPSVINDEGRIRIYFGSGPFRNMRCEGWKKHILSLVYSRVFGKPYSSFLTPTGPLGANVGELEDDMLTLSSKPKRILSENYGMHSFFEGSSIRKVRDKYFFVYSSSLNHELCYAISDYPDRDFKFMGTIVSNGDVGYEGRKEMDRVNATGTVHGCIERIGDDWYVFYHRLTGGSDYSRQVCSERIEIDEDYHISQVPLTSVGMDSKCLGKGKYSAAISCGLKRGHMPHIANRIVKGIPCIKGLGDTMYLSSMKKGTVATYKFFDLSDAHSFILKGRGKGTVCLIVNRKEMGKATFDSISWNERSMEIAVRDKKCVIEIEIIKGEVDLLEFRIE